MPRTRSLAWAELKIGMLTVFALTMAAILIFAVGGGSFFWQQYHLKVVFPNVAGLKSGSPVRLAGVEVGSVSDVSFVGTGVEVWFEVSKDQQSLITTDSNASIGSISLLGEGAVDITPAQTGTPVPEWGYLRAGPSPGSLAQATEEAAASLVEARHLIQDIRSGKGTMGKLFTDEALYRDLDRFVLSAERVTNAVTQGNGTLGRLTRDPTLHNELVASVRNLQEITARIKSGEGSLGRLMNDPAFAESLTGTTKNLEGVTARLNNGEGTAGKLLTDAALFNRLNSMAERLDTITGRLSAGEGTAGQLLQNKQLYENMNQTVTELRSLLTEIKKDPKKYLNVKVSIF
jgi:phospholipid/cholesterol/gamma-HCH transport system substrate-binding protein